MHIGLADDCGNFSLVVVKHFLQRLEIVPWHIEVVCYILLQNAGVVRFLRPLADAVVVALEEDDLLAAGMGAGSQNGQCGGIAAVLGKEGPVGRGHGIHQQFRKFHHLAGGNADAVLQNTLGCSSRIHIRIMVTQNIGAVAAQIVNEAVAVHIPEAGALGAGGIEGPCLHGGIAGAGRAFVAVDTGGNHLTGTGIQFPALGIITHHPSPSFMPDKPRPGSGCG